MANRSAMSYPTATIGYMSATGERAIRLAVRGLAIAAALAAMAMLSGCVRSPAQPQAVVPNATVVRDVDGDTIDVRHDQRGRLRVRIIGLDTPETHRPGVGVGCGGPEASAFAKRSLEGQRVAIVMDPGGDATDRYGRTLAGVFLPDGTNFAVLAVGQGYGRAYVYGHRPSKWAAEIQTAEDQARSMSRGIWGPPCLGDTHSDPLAYTRPARITDATMAMPDGDRLTGTRSNA